MGNKNRRLLSQTEGGDLSCRRCRAALAPLPFYGRLCSTAPVTRAVAQDIRSAVGGRGHRFLLRCHISGIYFWREKTQLGSKHWDESMFATYVGEHMGARHGQRERGKAGTHSMEHAVKGQ
jgi:hypothetical protein